MVSWESVLILPDTKLIDAIKIIDNNNPILIALVVNHERQLLGTVTDGDIRRGILNNTSMDEPVKHIMNPTPVTLSINSSKTEFNHIVNRNKLCRIIPILDEKSRVTGIKKCNGFFENRISNPVLIMAGGLGTRLRPLTDNCPKPLLTVGNKPILEIILDNFIDNGFYNFYISINYKGEMIEEYFGDGSAYNISITYIKEEKQLGTAGALSLLESTPDKPIIVMNGDLLTKVNFQQLLDFHNSNQVPATLCVREYDFQIPFGVAQVDNYRLTALKEKPTNKMFVNAGIYVLNPEILGMIPKDNFYNMTDLFSILLEKEEKPAVFPVREYWLDIGRISEYKKADEVYATLFDA
ncbi:MAG: nucleotidyltransferase family protein [Desulfobacula sp.]|jgi:dTDP-glucose pyrophosphorylase/CBS domain-containing protein|nr:nucleotidyltransferase family protein [Desulfobacula sp.]